MDKLWDAIRKTMKDGKDRSVMIGFKRVKIQINARECNQVKNKSIK
jgi:hypothetical protein